jgi:hypothetical protein
MTRLALVALLMRVWVAEAGWTAERDHAAMGYTLLRWVGVRGDDLPAVVHAMVDRHSRALDRHPWLTSLGADCAQPTGWPAKLSWGRHVPLCIALVRRAEKLLDGTLRDPCHGRADQWRARKSKALRSALRRGYKRVGCGRTVDAYLSEPN